MFGGNRLNIFGDVRGVFDSRLTRPGGLAIKTVSRNTLAVPKLKFAYVPASSK